MGDAVKSFGVKEFSRPDSDVDACVEEIKIAGFTILPDLLSGAELDEMRHKIDSIHQTQLEEIGGQQRLAAIGDTYTAMCLLAYDECFLRMATNEKVLSIVEKFLGDYFILMLQNGIVNVPQVGNDQTPGYWHRDLGYQHFVSSRPLGITALYAIDDFNAETGGTFLLPASHKTEAFPSEDFIRRHEQGVNAKAGSAIVFDSMLYHRAGYNKSQNIRRGVNNIYTLPLIKQQISLPKMLKGKYREDPLLGRLLGYESEPDENIIEFRERRLRRAESSPSY